MCALTFARRFLYNTSELPRDGASAGLRGGRSSGMLFSFAEYPSLNELSKGKSNDYHVPAEEGATIVRVDTAFGGARHA